ncbi:MAG: glycosyltransferase [Cytophagaceae bacterium]|nr:glycosyltransferase [Cytophagaceae bacterium]
MLALFEKRPILTILLVVGVMLLPFLDVLEVTIMEARNFISAREMLTDNHWILTTMNGEPRYQKPPLPTWLTALSALIFGIDSLWGLRLPAVLMVMLTGVMSYLLSRKLSLSKRQGLINGLITVTSLYVILIIFEAPWDIYAHGFMLTAIYFIVKATQFSSPSWSSYLAAILCIGCSVLSKGPVSVYVLLLPFLIAYFGIVHRSFVQHWSWLLPVLIAGLLLGFSWYFYVRVEDPETFAKIAQKETANWTSYNVRPFYYYWSFFIQSGLWVLPAFISLVYPYLIKRVTHKKGYLLSFWWTLLAVVLLSIIPEKKSRYLMPVLVPLAINIGFYITYLIKHFKGIDKLKERLAVYLNFGLIASVFVFTFLGGIYMIVFEDTVLYILGILSVLITTCCGIAMFVWLKQKRIYALFLTTVVGTVFGTLSVLSVLDTTQTTTTKTNAFRALETAPQLPVYAYRFTSPELVWAYGDKIPRVDSTDITSGALEIPALLLSCTACQTKLVPEKANFKMTLIDTIDINLVDKTDRNYRKRKTALVYHITKK